MVGALILAASMLAPIAPPSPPEFADVRIEDAYSFGVDKQSARALWTVANRHQHQMKDEVYSWNSPQSYEAWWAECGWRERCWYLLDDALYCDNLTREQKLRSLNELRGLIGDEDYYAGRMPPPIPNYRR